jgi:L-aminopeptidase/D-esterase-like protein
VTVTDVPGIRVGHWTDARARTGCTVVLFPEDTVASGEVRGGAPATREMALLAPERLVEHVDALVLSGGSAFGLAAGTGVVRWLAERGAGYPTQGGPVPIVVGLSIFDLTVGDGAVHPEEASGYQACETASDDAVQRGPVGAGAGATTGKWGGREEAEPGGLAAATVEDSGLVVAALVVVNCVGNVGEGHDVDLRLPPHPGFGNTTVGLLATNARLSKLECFHLAQGGHDGMARAIMPPHTRFDGDAMVAASAGEVDAHPETVRAMGVIATELAIRRLGREGV